MKYQVTLHNGQSFQITVDSEDFSSILTEQLNSNTIYFINLGGCVVHKNAVLTVLPIHE
mgnify:CR=1 FL=1